MKREKVLSVANATAYLITVLVNTLANALPINGKTTGELSNLYPNLFVPAGLTFAIWGLLYLLLLGVVIYQLIAAFGNRINAYFIHKIGPWFIISSIANVSWIIAWHYLFPVISLIIMLFLLLSLLYIYVNLQNTRSTADSATRLIVYPTFSMYLGWITVATIANATAVLIHLGWNGGLLAPEVWTIVMLVIASLLGAYFAIVKRDPFYAGVVVWALFGVYLKRSHADVVETGIIIASLVGISALLFSIVYGLLQKRKQVW